MVFCPEHPKRDQNLQFTPLSETTSIPVLLYRSSPPPLRLAVLDYVQYILGFHSREKAEIKMETFKYRKSRIWEMKEDKYTKSLAKNQVYAIVHMRDIRKNVLPKFIKLCMETPCLCPCLLRNS